MASAPPSLLRPGQPAASPTTTCPLNGATISAGPPAQTPLVPSGPPLIQRVVPCDIQSVTLTLAMAKGSVTLTGSKHKASEQPVADLPAEVNGLLAKHAVVADVILPAVTNSAGGAGRTSETAGVVSSAKATATASYAMKARCGNHPGRHRDPYPTAGDSNEVERVLSVTTREWGPLEFIKALFGGQNFRDFILGSQSTVTFAGTSCGWPASGDPTGGLSAYARIGLADEWTGQFRWAEGFVLKFSASESHGKDMRDGSRTDSSSRKVESSNKSLNSSSSSSAVRKDDKLLYAEGASSGGGVSIDYKMDAGPFSGSIEADMARYKSSDLPEDVSQKFEAQSKKLKDFSQDKGMAVTLTRNGKTLINTDNWGKILKEIQETLQTGMDLINRLVWLLENGAKVGIPVSITFGLSIALKLLQSSTYLRFWPEALPAKQSGTYYVSDVRRRWQLGVDFTVIDLSLTPSITVQAKVLHEWVAALTITIEGKIQGTAKIGYTITDATAATDIRAMGKIAMSIKGSGELSAVSFYAMVEGTASSAITYIYTCGYDGETMKEQHNQVTSDRLEFLATAKTGNKIWDFLGLGSEEPDWQWPKEGPFVWLQQGAINKEW